MHAHYWGDTAYGEVRRFGESRFNEGIATTVAGLGEYRQAEAKKIEWMKDTEVSPDRANSLILQAYEKRIVGARLLPKVIEEWRQPKHPEFRERTAWSLLNAFTEVIKDRQQRQPSRAAHETITLQKLIGGEYGSPVQAACSMTHASQGAAGPIQALGAALFGGSRSVSERRASRHHTFIARCEPASNFPPVSSPM